MAKKTKSTKSSKTEKALVEATTKVEEITEKEDAKQPVKVEKRTLCYLASKADHIIEIQYNGQTTYIQPYGKVKVIKEQIKLNSNDAKFLTFIKI